MSYNVTVLDKFGTHSTVFVAPDRTTIVSRHQLATNHQNKIEWPEHELATGSLNRAHFLSVRLHDQHETRDRFISRFLEPPLYQFKHHHGWGTLYTATYEPQTGECSFRWPGYCLNTGFQVFTEQTIALTFV
jgi:predicted choloylglycine hydrolase